MRRLSGLRFFMLRESVLSCFPGRLSCEQACLFTPFSKRMEMGQQTVAFRWFHSVSRVKGLASGVRRLRFTPFRRDSSCATRRQHLTVAPPAWPSPARETPHEGDGGHAAIAVLSLSGQERALPRDVRKIPGIPADLRRNPGEGLEAQAGGRRHLGAAAGKIPPQEQEQAGDKGRHAVVPKRLKGAVLKTDRRVTRGGSNPPDCANQEI